MGAAAIAQDGIVQKPWRGIAGYPDSGVAAILDRVGAQYRRGLSADLYTRGCAQDFTVLQFEVGIRDLDADGPWRFLIRPDAETEDARAADALRHNGDGRPGFDGGGPQDRHIGPAASHRDSVLEPELFRIFAG